MFSAARRGHVFGGPVAENAYPVMWIETRILFSSTESSSFLVPVVMLGIQVSKDDVPGYQGEARGLFVANCPRPPQTVMCGETEFCSPFLSSRPSPQPSPRLCGEREKTENGAANPGFRWRSTLGY